MKIVLIDKEEGLKIGGMGIYTQRLYHYLTSQNQEVSILRFAKKKPKGKFIYRIPYYLAEARSFIFLPSEKSLQIILTYLKKIKPDIVYTTIGLSPLDFLLPSISHNLKIPLAGVWHADFNYTSNPYQLLAKSLFLAYLPFCQQLDLLHVFSDKMAQFYIKRGIPKERVLVLPNGVDPHFYQPGTSYFAKRLGIKTGILFLGRLTLQKNPKILIESFLELNPPQETKLVLVGHGELEKELRQEFIDKRIIFTGVVKDERKKIDIVRACQIFVLPSRFEGMPLALLEAMSCGLACIASDAGSNRELLEKAGIVISATRMKEQLSLAISILLEYPEIAKKLGEEAREKILKYYSQKILFNHLLTRFKLTVLDFKKHGPPKGISLDLNRIITKKLKFVLREARKLTSYLEV